MATYDIVSKHIPKDSSGQTDFNGFVVLASEPPMSSAASGRYYHMPYGSRYLAKRRVMRTIRRLRMSS